MQSERFYTATFAKPRLNEETGALIWESPDRTFTASDDDAAYEQITEYCKHSGVEYGGMVHHPVLIALRAQLPPTTEQYYRA